MAPSLPPNRNTLNQRASRNRRRDYIHDLEQRVRAFEAQGVQATAELQSAARKVSEENLALREEIRYLRQRCENLERQIPSTDGKGGSDAAPHSGGSGRGSITLSRGRKRKRKPTAATSMKESAEHPSPPEIPGVLFHGNGMRVASSTSPLLSVSASAPGTPQKEGHNIERSDITHVSRSLTETNALAHPGERTGHSAIELEASSHPSSLQASSSAYQYLSPPISTTTSSPVPHPAKSCSTKPKTPNSTSCLEAALIIASMRGVSADEVTLETEIFPELGCTGTLERMSCRVGGESCIESSSDLRDGHAPDGKEEVDLMACVMDNGRLFEILTQDEH